MCSLLKLCLPNSHFEGILASALLSLSFDEKVGKDDVEIKHVREHGCDS